MGLETENFIHVGGVGLMNRLFKKVSAIGVTLAMAVTPVLAASTLADLPEPFVKNNSVVSSAIVVGNSADNAAGNVLQDYFTVNGAAGDITSSSDREEFFFGEDLYDQFGGTVDDSDIDGLVDGQISFQGESYDVHEAINISTSSSNYMFLTTSGVQNEEELEYDPALYSNGTGAIQYLYVFDDTFNDNLSTDDTLDITFLGQTLEISSTDASDDSITLSTSVEQALSQDDEYVWSGHTIHVGTIFDGKAEVWVDDGEHNFVSESNSKTWYVGGDTVQVEVDSVGFTEDVSSRTVILKIGEDITKTVSSGDAVQVELGQPDVDDVADDAEWIWYISIAGDDRFTSGDYIGVKHNQKINKYDDSPLPVFDGGMLTFPTGYITLDLEAGLVPESDYNHYTMELLENEDINSTVTQASIVVFTSKDTASSDDGLILNGQDAYQVACNGTGTCWYRDSDGRYAKSSVAPSGSNLQIESGSQTTKNIVFLNSTGAVGAGFVSGDTVQIIRVEDVESGDDNSAIDTSFLKFNVSLGTTAKFGATDGEADGEDLVYGITGTGDREVGTWDVNGGNLLTAYGIKVDGIESAFESDDEVVDLYVPTKEVSSYMTFNLRGSSGTTMPSIVSPSNAGSYSNVILVGGPCVNSMTAEWMGLSYPSCGSASTIPVDQALIKMMEDGSKTALIVAGWETADTKRAADKVADAGLTGSEVLV